jgi:hypothetical protein
MHLADIHGCQIRCEASHQQDQTYYGNRQSTGLMPEQERNQLAHEARCP